MPYVLSPMITLNSSGMWSEGDAYIKNSIYKIEAGKLPPVNYDEHILRSHSLTHLETPAHTQAEGPRLEHFYKNKMHHFFGKTIVIKLTGNNYKQLNDVFHWVIQLKEIQERLKNIQITSDIRKILISTEFYPKNNDGYHDPKYVLTLSQEAADYLVQMNNFDLYGTSWKSSDFNPGMPGRPIHDTLFKKALILENLDLENVPEGEYFMSAFPLPLIGASESPVVPILFRKDEILNCF